MPEGIEVLIDEDDITPDPDSPEADEVSVDEPEGEEQPELLAGKFKTPEELAKAYKELESKLGSQEPAADEAPDDGTIGGQEEPEAEAGEFTLDNVIEELSENDEISAETYDRLAKEKGMSRRDVDLFVEGVRARGDRIVNELAETAGGKDEFAKLRKWAKTNMPADEVKAYDEAVDSGNRTAAKLILRGMKAQYDAAKGQDPDLISGENVPSSTGAKPFKSIEQLVAAQGDRRYNDDPAYREKVDARIGATDWL